MSSTVDENDSMVLQDEKPDDGRRSGQDGNTEVTMNGSPEGNSASICEMETETQKKEASAIGKGDSDQEPEEEPKETKSAPGSKVEGNDQDTPERIHANKEKGRIKDPGIVPDVTSREGNCTEENEKGKERSKIQNEEGAVEIMSQASEQNQSESKATTGKTQCNPSAETTPPNELGAGHKATEQTNTAEQENFVSKIDQTSSKEGETGDNKNDNDHANAGDSKGLSTFALYQAMAQQQEKAKFQQQAGAAVAKIQGDDSITVEVDNPNQGASSTDMGFHMKNNSFVPQPSVPVYSGYPADPCYFPHNDGMSGFSLSKSAAYPYNNYIDPSTSTFKLQKPNDEHTKWWSQYYSKYYELMSTTLPGAIPPPPPNPWLLPNLGLGTNENNQFETNKLGNDVAAAPFKKRRVFSDKDASGGVANAVSQTLTQNSGGKNPSSEASQDQVATSEKPALSPEKQSQHSPLQQTLEQENSTHGYSEAFQSNEKFATL